MEAALIDPRDVTCEVDSPAYRVYFWQSMSCQEWRLTGARDVHEVLEWAELRAGERSFTVHVEVDVAQDERGMIRLAGMDPTRTETRGASTLTLPRAAAEADPP